MHGADYLWAGIVFLCVAFFAPIMVWSEWGRTYDMSILSGCIVASAIIGMSFKGMDGAATGRLDYMNEISIYFTFCITFLGVFIYSVMEVRSKGDLLKSLKFWRMAWMASLAVFGTVLYFEEYVVPAGYTGPTMGVPQFSIHDPNAAVCDMSTKRYQVQVDASPVMIWSLILMIAATFLFYLLSLVGEHSDIFCVFWNVTANMMVLAMGVYMLLMWTLLHTCTGKSMVYQNIPSYGAYVMCGTFVSMLFGVITGLPLLWKLVGWTLCASKWWNEMARDAFIDGTLAYSLYRKEPTSAGRSVHAVVHNPIQRQGGVRGAKVEYDEEGASLVTE